MNQSVYTRQDKIRILQCVAIFLVYVLFRFSWPDIKNYVLPMEKKCPAIAYLPNISTVVECKLRRPGYSLYAHISREEYLSFIDMHNSEHPNSLLVPISKGRDAYFVDVINSEFEYILAEWNTGLLMFWYVDKTR